MTQPIAVRHRTLRFEGGAAHTTILHAINGDPRVRTDVATGMSGLGPHTEVAVVHRPRFADRMLRPPPPRTIWLPASSVWSIEVNGPAANLGIYLEAVALQAVQINGGVSRLALRLSAPRERVPIAVAGAVRALTLDRPASAPVTVAVRGSVRNLEVDHRAIHNAAGPVVLGEPLGGSTPGYDLRIVGPVAGLRVSTRSV